MYRLKSTNSTIEMQTSWLALDGFTVTSRIRKLDDSAQLRGTNFRNSERASGEPIEVSTPRKVCDTSRPRCYFSDKLIRPLFYLRQEKATANNVSSLSKTFVIVAGLIQPRLELRIIGETMLVKLIYRFRWIRRVGK